MSESKEALTIHALCRTSQSLVGNCQDSIETIDIAASGKMNVKYGLKGLLDLQQ